MPPNQTLCLTDVQRVLSGLFEGDLHAKRVLSLANATLGVIRTASLAVHTIGQRAGTACGDALHNSAVAWQVMVLRSPSKPPTPPPGGKEHFYMG